MFVVRTLPALWLILVITFRTLLFGLRLRLRLRLRHKLYAEFLIIIETPRIHTRHFIRILIFVLIKDDTECPTRLQLKPVAHRLPLHTPHVDIHTVYVWHTRQPARIPHQPLYDGLEWRPFHIGDLLPAFGDGEHSLCRTHVFARKFDPAASGPRCPTMTDYKETIIRELDVLRRTSASESAGVFKSRQYAAAIKTLRELPTVRSLDDLPPASQKGTGLGGKIREKIQQIMMEGSLSISEEKRTAADTLETFRNVYGIGPKKAEELVAAGYKSIAELRAAAAADPKFLNRNQRVGLDYYEQLLTRIPRPEMDQHAAILMSALPDDLEGVIVGSYRRGRPDSGDIDMLLRVKDASLDAGDALTAYVDTLTGMGYIKEVLAHGPHKCLAISQIPAMAAAGGGGASIAARLPARRLDLLVSPPEEFAFAVFYFTGSDGFNVRVRQHALSMGLTLNEHALTVVKTGVPIQGIKTERDLFNILKLEWREPQDRTGPEAVVVRS
jgi:DNA polymerase/3'-5' exonuclease PolX